VAAMPAGGWRRPHLRGPAAMSPAATMRSPTGCTNCCSSPSLGFCGGGGAQGGQLAYG
jgi:hypothetical protein